MTYYDAKGSGYRTRYEFWLSADRVILALVGGGKLFGIPIDAVSLYSRADGRYLLTINSDKASEYDLTKLVDEVLVPHAGVGALLDRHRRRVKAAGAVDPYSSDNPLTEHAEMLRRRVGLLVAAWNAGYLDDEEEHWRYSVKGAVLMSAKAMPKALRRMVWKD